MARSSAKYDRARGVGKTRLALLLAPALLLWPGSPGTAGAVHSPVGPCSPRYLAVKDVDLETFFDGKTNLTICLAGDLEDKVSHDVQWSNMSHVTVRSAPGTWRSIRSRIWIDETSSNVTIYGLTLDAGDYDGTPGYAGIAVNGDNVILRRNLITNRYGAAGSCIINDNGYGVADDTVISQNRIYDCGRDETHDHGIYTNAMNRPVVNANWIYANASRGINLGPYTQNGQFTRNVISDNCANPLGGVNDCGGNITFWGSTSNTNFSNNTVGFPAARWNLAGCDFSPDTPSCPVWTGSNNQVTRSCFHSTVSGYNGDPPDSGISPGWKTFAPINPATITTANPGFAGATTPAHALRNYRIPAGNPCHAYQPVGSVGPPAP
jgi:hypothetical protein